MERVFKARCRLCARAHVREALSPDVCRDSAADEEADDTHPDGGPEKHPRYADGGVAVVPARAGIKFQDSGFRLWAPPPVTDVRGGRSFGIRV
jgi:hypothetical protein